MKYTVTIEGDYYEDSEELKAFVHIQDIKWVNDSARELIKSSLKHGDYDQKTNDLLERLRETLYVAGVT